jgi:nucleoside-diphosphate-sugar epimerase
LGSKILRSLRSSGFNVTAIQRKGSDRKLPQGIKSIQVDLTSKSELTAAFKGQDVVVRYISPLSDILILHSDLCNSSAVPNPELNDQKTLVDAAIEAGIKRIVPSEFSSNLEAKAKDVNLPIVSEKLAIRKYVVEAAATGKIEWSSINNGPFLDLGVNYGFLGPNIRSKKATFHDGGEKVCCTTSTEDIGKAVALMLEHHEETKNKPVYIYSTLISEKKMTNIVAKLKGIDFEIQEADVEKDAEEYLASVKEGNADSNKKFSLYFQMMYGEGFGGDYRDMAMNETIGLRVMSDEELEADVARWLKVKPSA